MRQTGGRFVGAVLHFVGIDALDFFVGDIIVLAGWFCARGGAYYQVTAVAIGLCVVTHSRSLVRSVISVFKLYFTVDVVLFVSYEYSIIAFHLYDVNRVPLVFGRGEEVSSALPVAESYHLLKSNPAAKDSFWK